MRSKKRKQKSKRRGMVCVFCAVLAVMLVMGVQIMRLYEKNEAYAAQQEQLESQIAEEEQRALELAEEAEYVGTDEYVEEVARTKLGMIYEDEILFKED